MTTRWIYKEDVDEQVVAQLSQDLEVNPIIAKILVQRGITNTELARNFFRPSLDLLHDPFLLEDMDKALIRIKKAIDTKENILIYGDYDVDGTTSVALVYGFFKNFYQNVQFYLPDRGKEGYGISIAGIDWAAENNITLMISLDCGIKAVDVTEYANKKDIDLIICDHHLPGEKLPQAYAILDPKVEGCRYPFNELSGCGVGFKLLQAYCEKYGYDPDLLYDYLDLVAVSIAADIVPIVGENRILAYHGLNKLNDNPRIGLQALIKMAGIKNEVNITSIVFGIGPRINASGRMSHAKTAVDLLLADDYKSIEALAESLDNRNLERRDLDSATTHQAFDMIDKNVLTGTLKSTVLFKEDWHKGVIGIVASRCIDKYYRPTIILTKSNGKATGSARSVDGFDIYEAISQCADLLDQYGGHMYAAGLTLSVDNVEAFKEKFERIVAESISSEQLVPLIDIDAVIRLKDISFKFHEILEQMAPFGPGNMQPVFVSHLLHVYGRPRILKNQHLKFFVKQDNDDTPIEVIGFGFAEYYEMIDSGMRFSMAYYIDINKYQENTSLQLRVKDIRFEEV
ncbi:MAG: single-stranded-DNA-specific exonuclease RecJ [Cyclobacteriaceae bacterium]|nr:single-stranded-DNA-specific exonuclease RecJ [Cyclobacteriaceae bacterium]